MRPHNKSSPNTELFCTLNAASTCSTTGSGQCSILHCRLWLMHPGFHPVIASSNSQHLFISRKKLKRKNIRVLSHNFAKKPPVVVPVTPGTKLNVLSASVDWGSVFSTHSNLNISVINWCLQGTDTLPMAPVWGSTSKMSQAMIFSHVYLINDLLLFHIWNN